MADSIKPEPCRQDGAEKSGFDHPVALIERVFTRESVMQFIIKAGDARFTRVVAHFT